MLEVLASLTLNPAVADAILGGGDSQLQQVGLRWQTLLVSA